ncbi:MAG: hypothetical protein LWW94_10720, partial [Candidatus Desulfofervidaceae bacterium]|nr:hypothetical protein [Candidatus Desulfofervidaceae bacterium]
YIKEGLLNSCLAYQFIPSFSILEDVLPLVKENFHTFAGVSELEKKKYSLFPLKFPFCLKRGNTFSWK